MPSRPKKHRDMGCEYHYSSISRPRAYFKRARMYLVVYFLYFRQHDKVKMKSDPTRQYSIHNLIKTLKV